MNPQKYRKYPPLISLLAVVTLGSGCTIGYYSQSVAGHLNIMCNREDINTLLEDKDTPPKLKEKLALVLQIREYASDELALPRNDSYTSYVDLGREHVVWNVVAAPEFSLELEKWCFLMVGCVNYRGYFSEQDAREFARKLSAQGKDVYVPGADAYSTLGWFDDPMLSTLIKHNEPRLAGLMFHELAHQLLFIKGDSAFNESFAKTVELEGMRRWMRHRGTPELMQLYIRQNQRETQFVELVRSTADELKRLYAESLPQDIMRSKKDRILLNMRERYLQLRANWDEYNGYDAWFAGNLNNAKLGTVGIYRDLVPAFQALLQRHDGDLRAFYAAAEQLSEMPKERRAAELEKLLQNTGG